MSVISVCSPVQALAAVAVHDPDRDFRDDAAAMGAAAAAMRYASVRPAQDTAARRPGATRPGATGRLSDSSRRMWPCGE